MIARFKGLVLSEIPWGDNDKLISVLTAEAGKIGVLLKGGASLKNRSAAACIPLSYSEFVTADRGGRPWVREATESEGFSRLRTSLDDMAVALYMCDVADEVCVENGDEAEMLQLMLNTLFALDRGLKPRRLIKAEFEMRTAAVCGFTPDLVGCSECGKENDETMYLDVMDGVMHCSDCRKKHDLDSPREGHTALLMALEKPMLDCMRYVCYSNAKRYLSFELPDVFHERFCYYCEQYLLNHLGKGFRSLDFLHSLER